MRAVTLTGSEGAGRSVAEAAGRALKKSVLELGGSDPFVVLPSADLERAVAVGVQARVQNNGQSCIAAKRFIVHDAVLRRLRGGVRARYGAPGRGRPHGPGYRRRPPGHGAGPRRCGRTGRRRPGQGRVDACAAARRYQVPGFFYRPTVLAGITPSMRVHNEEVFGPVALLYRAADAADALRMANDTQLRPRGQRVDVGRERALDLRRRASRSGMVFVNAMVASTPELPFGGTKRSGYGRELSVLGHHGVLRGQDRCAWPDALPLREASVPAGTPVELGGLAGGSRQKGERTDQLTSQRHRDGARANPSPRPVGVR